MILRSAPFYGRAIGYVLTGCLAALVTGFVATPAFASGGGCSPYTQNGVNVSPCISASSGNWKPDFYVNTAGGCAEIAAVLWIRQKSDGNWTWANSWNTSCSLGHHGPWSYSITNTDAALTRVFAFSSSNSQLYSHTSPTGYLP
jgi:hypothetical protein